MVRSVGSTPLRVCGGVLGDIQWLIVLSLTIRIVGDPSSSFSLSTHFVLTIQIIRVMCLLKLLLDLICIM